MDNKTFVIDTLCSNLAPSHNKGRICRSNRIAKQLIATVHGGGPISGGGGGVEPIIYVPSNEIEKKLNI